MPKMGRAVIHSENIRVAHSFHRNATMLTHYNVYLVLKLFFNNYNLLFGHLKTSLSCNIFERFPGSFSIAPLPPAARGYRRWINRYKHLQYAAAYK